MASQIELGSKVKFIGFEGEEPPTNGEYLEKGKVYEVISVNEEEDGNEESYNIGPIEIENPNYNPKKRNTKNNQPTQSITVDVFMSECKLVDGDQDEEEDADNETIEYDAAKKGDMVGVQDTDGEYTEGEIIKKSQRQLTILVSGDDGEEEVTYKKSEVEALYALADGEAEESEDEEGQDEEEQDEEEEEEEAPEPVKKKAAAKKAAAKKTAAKKTTAKKTTAKKTAAKEDKETADPELKGLIVLDDDQEDEEILGLIEEAGDDICGLAEELAEESVHADYKLGGVLSHVYRTKAYKEIKDGEFAGEKGFARYCDSELGVGYRKAMYLIKAYGVWRREGLSQEDFTAVGWTKVVKLLSVINEENAEELIELAKESNVPDLEETIRESYSAEGGTKGTKVKKVSFNFKLTEDAGVTVQDFFELAGEQLSLKDNNAIFEHIVMEWGQEHLDVASRKTKATKKTAAKKTAAKKATVRNTRGS